MSGYLLDTNVISELVRPKPSPQVVEWIEAVDEDVLYLSVLTLGEIRQGIAGLDQGKRRARLETWLEVDLRERFGDRILDVTPSIADRWGAIAAEARQAGRALAVIDGLLAATAADRNLVVVSRNHRDFEGTKVAVVNPWGE